VSLRRLRAPPGLWRSRMHWRSNCGCESRTGRCRSVSL